MTGAEMTRWWSLMPAEQFKASVMILAMVARGGGLLDASLAQLSTALSTSKTTAHRALSELHRIGLIDSLSTTQGRAGSTRIVSQCSERLATSVSWLFSTENQKQNGNVPNVPAGPRSPVLDLSDSPKKSDSDPQIDLIPRSPTLEREEVQRAPQTTPADNPQGKKRPPTESAFRHADEFRRRVADYDPRLALAGKDYAGESPRRMALARVMDRINRRGVEWGEIAGVIRALYPDQGASRARELEGFAVTSGDDFAAKFDRVREARKRARAMDASRQRSAVPDNRPAPEFKKLTLDDGDPK